MIGAVIGLGPRTGTSYVMEQLELHGFRVKYVDDNLPDADREGGHFELPDDMIPAAYNEIVKLWPNGYRKTLIERALFLYREDRKAHIESVRRQQAREGLTNFQPESLINACVLAADELEVPEVMAVEMHDIDNSLDEIIQFFSIGGYRAHCSNSVWSNRSSRYCH